MPLHISSQDSVSVAKICGKAPMRTFLLKGQFEINFRSDGDETHRGFKMIWEAKPGTKNPSEVGKKNYYCIRSESNKNCCLFNTSECGRRVPGPRSDVSIQKGKGRSSVENRIVGGTPAGKQGHPWQASITLTFAKSAHIKYH